MTGNLVAEIRRRGIPPLYAQEENADPVIYLELSLLQFSWRWYVTECEIEDGERGDVLFFGYVAGDFSEWGYFRLSELTATRLPLLINANFKPLPFSALKKRDL